MACCNRSAGAAARRNPATPRVMAAAPTLPVARSRAAFFANPPDGTVGVEPIRFSTLADARRYAADHPGWKSEMKRVPIEQVEQELQRRQQV